jgi:hypothetical protein
VLLGDSGTGKTHLLIGLGLIACEQGRRVRYATTARLVNELIEAADDRQLSRVVARYARLDLLCLDELGYVELDRRGAELLFQIIAEREERAAIATASNLPFSEWGTIFPDPRLAAAIVDRLTFNGHIIETGTTSYRLAHGRAARAAKRGGQPGGRSVDRPGFGGGCDSTRPTVLWPLIDSSPVVPRWPAAAPEREGVNLERPQAEPLAAQPRTNEVDAAKRRCMIAASRSDGVLMGPTPRWQAGGRWPR